MKIGQYSFDEFKSLAASFHGYPAPGLLIGGYMVSLAKSEMAEGVLFEAVVETKKCLPDAVQLLTLCSTGNNWMKVINLGKYALSLFDKYTGEGYRVNLDVDKLGPYPEIKAWLFKTKPKAEQNTVALFAEIKKAGWTICTRTPVKMRSALLGPSDMGSITVCPRCGEAFPQNDGIICRGCQGEAPYLFPDLLPEKSQSASPRLLPAEEAVGKKILHDMTRIVPGNFKGAEFKAGQEIAAGDVCRLQQMGRFTLAVEGEVKTHDLIHENEAAQAFAERMAGANIEYKLPPSEGKIDFKAAQDGLFAVDIPRLNAFNMTPDVMAATRHDGSIVNKDTTLAGTRAIPLFLSKDSFASALAILTQPLFAVLPMRRAKVGILVTGTEVFKGLIEDKFIPVISDKVARYQCEIIHTAICPDEQGAIGAALKDIRQKGADLLVTTGGLSVDPEDITRTALLNEGLTHALHGMPVLPGSMSLLGLLPAVGCKKASEAASTLTARQPQGGELQVIGVPACALYFKTTIFDALLPRLLAGQSLTRPLLASLGHGGICHNCKICTYPKCWFLK